MTTIADKDREMVRKVFCRELVETVELVLFTTATAQPRDGDTATSRGETAELLTDIASLTDRIRLTTIDVAADRSAAFTYNVSAVPTVLVRRHHSATVGVVGHPGGTDGAARPSVERAGDASPIGSGGAVRFLGLPSGYEFSTLIADIVDVSRGRTDLSDATRAVVRGIGVPVHIQVFVTPGCPSCPRTARLAHQIAMENPLIVADVIEAREFQELSARYRVQAVPKTVINDRVEMVGALTEALALDGLRRATSSRGSAGASRG